MVKFIVLFVVVIAVAMVVALYLTRDKRWPVQPPSDIDHATYRNHQHMARMLDKVVNDDFISGVVPDNTKVEIRILLSEYYGKELREGT